MIEWGHLMSASVRTVLVFMLLAASGLKAETLVGKCTDIADGDTLTLTLPDKSTEKIRLYGIDAPEKQQDYAEEAKQRLTELTAGKEIRAEVMNRDRYGRAVAKVFTGKTDVCLAMVSGGCAWHYVIYAPLDIELAEAEALASAQKWGLWQHPHPIAPWEFRKGARPAKPNEHNHPYWVTESGRVHNARCKYFGTTQNGHYTAQPQSSATDCNLCGGKESSEHPSFPTWWNILLLVLFLGLLPLILLRLLIIRARKN